MEKIVKGYIKFTDKKCKMRPFEDVKGAVETWAASDAITNRQWFIHKGIKYQLGSSVEK